MTDEPEEPKDLTEYRKRRPATPTEVREHLARAREALNETEEQ